MPDARNGVLGHACETCLEGVAFKDQFAVISGVRALELDYVAFSTQCILNEGIAGNFDHDLVGTLAAGAEHCLLYVPTGVHQTAGHGFKAEGVVSDLQVGSITGEVQCTVSGAAGKSVALDGNSTLRQVVSSDEVERLLIQHTALNSNVGCTAGRLALLLEADRYVVRMVVGSRIELAVFDKDILSANINTFTGAYDAGNVTGSSAVLLENKNGVLPLQRGDRERLQTVDPPNWTIAAWRFPAPGWSVPGRNCTRSGSSANHGSAG